MGEFFKGWRRKTGAATLVMACMLMGGWVRSEISEDTIILSDEHGRTIIETHSLLGIVHFSTWNLDWSECRLFSHYSDEIEESGPQSGEGVDRLLYWEAWKEDWLPNNPNMGRWKWLGIEYYVNYQDDDRQEMSFYGYLVPYWLIVTPLTLLSTYLLLSKPCKSTTKKSTEPIMIEGT